MHPWSYFASADWQAGHVVVVVVSRCKEIRSWEYPAIIQGDLSSDVIADIFYAILPRKFLKRGSYTCDDMIHIANSR